MHNTHVCNFLEAKTEKVVVAATAYQHAAAKSVESTKTTASFHASCSSTVPHLSDTTTTPG